MTFYTSIIACSHQCHMCSCYVNIMLIITSCSHQNINNVLPSNHVFTFKVICARGISCVNIIYCVDIESPYVHVESPCVHIKSHPVLTSNHSVLTSSPTLSSHRVTLC